MNVEVDHLVVGARTLDEGVAWCEATLGITPGAGGRHALMSTHNRLANLSSATFPRSYLEVIAIDPQLLHTEGVHMAAGTLGRLSATLSTPLGVVTLASND